MLNFIVTPGHENTVKAVVPRTRKWRAPLKGRVWTYPQVFRRRHLPAGTWILTDFERLADWELGLAGELARLIRNAGPGFRLLNDPARAACRYEMLLRLHRAGFNGFRAWRAEDDPADVRFPVFLRVDSHHGAPLTDLIHTPDDLEKELAALRNKGVPRRGLLVIEYQAEPLEGEIFRKYGAYRFGDRIVADHLVHEKGWLVKYGDAKAWTPQHFADEAAFVAANPHSDDLMTAFEIAGIDYGRADYGLIDGRVQIWEINTSPYLPSGNLNKALPLRDAATVQSKAGRLDALRALDVSAPGQSLQLDGDLLTAHRSRQRLFARDFVRP